MISRKLDVDPEREEQELRAYLGGDFDLDKLRGYQQTLEREYEEIGDEQVLYRTSTAYLYNLTAFAMTRTKVPYLRELARHVPPGARVLDYGCGIGSDGLLLSEAGYDVEFADFANPSVQYLRWRLDRRGIDARIHDLDEEVPGGFDAAFAFDVIEHVDDPFAFLQEMENRADLVTVNFLEPDPADQDLHHELPVRSLVDRAAAMDLRSYGVHHGGSHLVLYAPLPSPGRKRLAQMLSVRVHRRLNGMRGFKGGPH